MTSPFALSRTLSQKMSDQVETTATLIRARAAKQFDKDPRVFQEILKSDLNFGNTRRFAACTSPSVRAGVF
jgi:hypothetical protein